MLGVVGCEFPGDVGQLVCPELVTRPGQVRVNQPGGAADVLINPVLGFSDRVVVRSIDAAGNRSAQVEYEFWAPDSGARPRDVRGHPAGGRAGDHAVAPHEGVDGTTWSRTGSTEAVRSTS